MSKLRELVDKANGLWAPQERPFTSTVPLLGSVIIALRRALNWMSAKWYVRAILEQQIVFNSVMVQVINEMCQALEDLDGRGQRVEEGLVQIRRQIEESAQRTAARLIELEEAFSRRLSDLESGLSNQIREAEELTIANDRANTALGRELARLSHRIKAIDVNRKEGLFASGEMVGAPEKAAGKEDANSLL